MPPRASSWFVDSYRLVLAGLRFGGAPGRTVRPQALLLVLAAVFAASSAGWALRRVSGCPHRESERWLVVAPAIIVTVSLSILAVLFLPMRGTTEGDKQRIMGLHECSATRSVPLLRRLAAQNHFCGGSVFPINVPRRGRWPSWKSQP